MTLAWTDAPGSTTGNAFNNDLDLTVVVGGNVYKGNVFSGPSSISGGSADPRNNVESVFLPAGITGPFAVIVTAANINSNGVPGNAVRPRPGLRPRRLQCRGGSLPGPGGPVGDDHGRQPGIDPNECHDLTLTLKNWGTAAATNIVATLATSTPGASIAAAELLLSEPRPGRKQRRTRHPSGSAPARI